MLRNLADDHARAFRHKLEKLGDVGVAEPHTSMAGRRSDEIFAICTVKIDVAIARVGVVRIQPCEPQNSRQDAILLSAGCSNLAGGLAAFEHTP